MHEGLPALKKSHYQQLAYAFALRGKDYEYAWCVEHDVALTGGNWLGFYEAHASDARDLLAWRVGWVPKDAKPHKGGAWNAGMMTGPRFDCFQNGRGGWPFSTCHGGHAEVAILFGAVVRYSSRFASLLDQDGAADPPSYGHSETAVPTLCNITQWCTMGNISAAWVGINRCVNRISGAPRHRHDVVSVAASARWRGVSRPSTRRCPRDRVGSMVWRFTKAFAIPRIT